MRVLQIFRAPVGGLYRHVSDLVAGLNSSDVQCGVIFSSNEVADEHIKKYVSDNSSLGNFSTSMSRGPGLSDLLTFMHIVEYYKKINPDIVHGHGAKGGMYARLLSAAKIHKGPVIYTPHGGSLHYSGAGLMGFIFKHIEKYLASHTSAVVFESKYSKNVYVNEFGINKGVFNIIHNGLGDSEFADSGVCQGAADFVYLGELRILKGVDVLIEAVAILRDKGFLPRVKIFGVGPDESIFRARVAELNLDNISFEGRSDGCDFAFLNGRCVIFPSRAESLPYVLLEAVSRFKPIISTNVGGVSEILGNEWPFVKAGDAEDLARAMGKFISEGGFSMSNVELLKFRDKFSKEKMVSDIYEMYCSLLGTSRNRA